MTFTRVVVIMMIVNILLLLTKTHMLLYVTYTKSLTRAFMRTVAKVIMSGFSVGKSDTIAFNNINNQNCLIYHILG